jgi:hypothetical protein
MTTKAATTASRAAGARRAGHAGRTDIVGKCAIRIREER